MTEKPEYISIEIEKSILKIQDNIDNLIAQKNLINNIDFSKPLNENQWHELCKTPLRYSDLLCFVVKKLFPQSKNIKLNANHVSFDLFNFQLQIPTTNSIGIAIDTSWYVPDKCMPKIDDYYSGAYCKALRLKEYFRLVDTKSIWYKTVHWNELAKLRIGNSEYDQKWFLFCKWFLYYKWKNDKRQVFEKRFRQIQLNYLVTVELHYKRMIKAKEQVKILINDVLPLVNKFSTKYIRYSQWNKYTIEQILKMEGIINDKQ